MIRLGITDSRKFINYERWFNDQPDIEVVKLTHEDEGLEKVKACSGVLFSGGVDVHPRFYNKLEYVDLCHGTFEARDEFELSLMKLTQDNDMPVLGICRGMQIMNVYFGGSLIPDLTDNPICFHPTIEKVDSIHHVNVHNGWFRNIIGEATGFVNSAHHQAVDKIGEGLTLAVSAPDGVVEALERSDPNGKSFLMMVQWHPERMNDDTNVMRVKIKSDFLRAVRGR